MKGKIFTLTALAAFTALNAMGAIEASFRSDLLQARKDLINYGPTAADPNVYEYITGTPDEFVLAPGEDYGNTLIAIAPFSDPISTEYSVFAFDYKVDTDYFSKITVLGRVGGAGDSGMPGDVNTPLTIKDNWQTIYVVLNTDNAAWYGGDDRDLYFVFDQTSNAKPGPFTINLKNPRFLTPDEATDDALANVSGDQAEEIDTYFHGLGSDFDDLEGLTYYYIPENGLQEGEQAIIVTKNRTIPLAEGNTTLKMNYNSSDDFDIHVMAVMEDQPWYAKEVGKLHLNGRGDDFGMDLSNDNNWDEASVDLSSVINEDGFGKKFGAKHYLWLQCYEAPNFAMFFVKNLRWTSDGGAGIGNVSDNNAPARAYAVNGGIAVEAETYTVYNTAGMVVASGNGNATVKVANGLYIVVADGQTAKIIVK